MTTQTEDKIFKKLEQIEGLLARIVPSKTELTEEDALKIIEEGDRDYANGRTENVNAFLRRGHPQLNTRKS